MPPSLKKYKNYTHSYLFLCRLKFFSPLFSSYCICLIYKFSLAAPSVLVSLLDKCAASANTVLILCSRSDSNDCPSSRACRDFQCVDVCAGSCGVNADCQVRNHVPVCSCPARHTGDPFANCRYMDPRKYTIMASV